MGSPSIASLFAQRVVVGVGELSASNNVGLILSTYALGSCVAVAAYDPSSKAAGLLHIMLPASEISPAKAQAQPAMFANTGLPLLFKSLLGLRADLSRLRIFVAGGASVLCAADPFKIGERNTAATLDFLARNGLKVHYSALGGTINRTVHLAIETGLVTLKTPDGSESFLLGG